MLSDSILGSHPENKSSIGITQENLFEELEYLTNKYSKQIPLIQLKREEGLLYLGSGMFNFSKPTSFKSPLVGFINDSLSRKGYFEFDETYNSAEVVEALDILILGRHDNVDIYLNILKNANGLRLEEKPILDALGVAFYARKKFKD